MLRWGSRETVTLLRCSIHGKILWLLRLLLPLLATTMVQQWLVVILTILAFLTIVVAAVGAVLVLLALSVLLLLLVVLLPSPFGETGIIWSAASRFYQTAVSPTTILGVSLPGSPFDPCTTSVANGCGKQSQDPHPPPPPPPSIRPPAMALALALALTMALVTVMGMATVMGLATVMGMAVATRRVGGVCCMVPRWAWRECRSVTFLPCTPLTVLGATMS